MTEFFKPTGVAHIGFPCRQIHRAMVHWNPRGQWEVCDKGSCCERNEKKALERYSMVICEYVDLPNFTIALAWWGFGRGIMDRLRKLSQGHPDGFIPDMRVRPSGDPFRPYEIVLDHVAESPRWLVNRAVDLAAEKMFDSMPLWKGYEKLGAPAVVRVSRIELLFAED